MLKWIIITGGVLSGLGKGIVSSSIGALLSEYKVIPVKCDGYLNVDPGTMNPIEHGEVFVLEDGGEVDMDFGHYERFLNINCKFDWNLTSGKIFQSVIEKERKGHYLGQTVQMIPHVTNEIKDRLLNIASDEKADIMLVEIGGTIGDIENELFIEAIRQLKLEQGKDNFLFVHLTYLPELYGGGEQKTKPTQQSTKSLLERGIQPDIIVGRSEHIICPKNKRKIALFCNVEENDVISDPDTSSVYDLPLIFQRENLHERIASKLKINISNSLSQWNKLVKTPKDKKVNIAICGKYTDLQDSYVSIVEALNHSGFHLGVDVELAFIDTEEEFEHDLKNMDGIIVPGGFGSRGSTGKIKVIKYARENNIPFLGLCFGMQLAVVEFARNVCGISDACSSEVSNNSENKIIDFLPGQEGVDKGGSMRLGKYPCNLVPDSLVSRIYGSDNISERHRHRLEVNPSYHEVLEKNGLLISGKSPDGKLAEFIEIPSHKFFVATQAHPELTSKLLIPNPVFKEFVKVCSLVEVDHISNLKHKTI